MKNKINKLYELENKLLYKYLINKNIFLLQNLKNIYYIYMPKNFFLKKENKNYFFLFVKKSDFYSIYKQFINFYKNLYKIFFFKLKLRGLGYRIKKISKNLYRFFFAYNHYFYFHISIDLFVKKYKRNLIIFSNNLSKLNDVFAHLLILKKLDFYERTNTFIISKKILYLKKRK